MKKNISIKYQCDILNDKYFVEVFIGSEEGIKKELKIYFEGNDFQEENFDRMGLTFSKERYNPLIWINTKYVSGKIIYEVLAHEAYHAVDYILEDICSNHKDDEVIAHSIGAIITKYNETIKKMTNKQKEKMIKMAERNHKSKIRIKK
jgi:hypothetical protein